MLTLSFKSCLFSRNKCFSSFYTLFLVHLDIDTSSKNVLLFLMALNRSSNGALYISRLIVDGLPQSVSSLPDLIGRHWKRGWAKAFIRLSTVVHYAFLLESMCLMLLFFISPLPLSLLFSLCCVADEIVSTLGEGTFGRVMRCIDHRRWVSVKDKNCRWSSRLFSRRRFLNIPYKIQAKLENRSIDL